MFAAICNDLACGGGDDILVQDNSSLDTNATLGAIVLSTSAFGYTVLVNTSQSKPVIGAAGDPELDLTFTATTADDVSRSVFLYTSDTDFTGTQSFTVGLGGTHTNGSGTVTGRAWGGTNNTALSFSGANLLGTVGPFTAAAYAGTTTGSLIPTVTPYSLTIGVAINRSLAGSTTGDLSFSSTQSGGGSGAGQSVPEPMTLLLFGTGLAWAGARARRRA
jgi:hypothetical protein